MCLSVTHVPDVDKGEIVVQQVYKNLIATNFKQYVTPYVRSSIPRNGLLVPRIKRQIKDFYYSDPIGLGFIHSYTIIPKWNSPGVRTFMAIAIDVKAYSNHPIFNLGKCERCISKALYIPKIDYTRTESEKKEILDQLGESEIWSKEEILAIFPSLKNKIG